MSHPNPPQRRLNRWLWPLLLIAVALGFTHFWLKDHKSLSEQVKSLKKELEGYKLSQQEKFKEHERLNERFHKLWQDHDRLSNRVALQGKPIVVTGRTADGEVFDWSQYKGKVVLLHCWAEGWPVCQNDFPFVKKLHEKYNERGLEVVGICLNESSKDAIPYLEQQHVSWPNLMPPARRTTQTLPMDLVPPYGEVPNLISSTTLAYPLINGVFIEWPMTWILVDRQGDAAAIVDIFLDKDSTKNSPKPMFDEIERLLQQGDYLEN